MEHVEDGCGCEGKFCSTCKVTLCIGAFPKSSKQWRNTYCKKCRSEYNKRYSSVPSHQERQRIYHNEGKWKEYYKEYYAEYRERQDPKQFQLYSKNRKARMIQAGGSHTKEEWENLKRTYDYTCLCCGKREPEIKLSEDHVIPVVHGGHSNIDNIQPLCKSCNSLKGKKIIDFRPKKA